jgi:hypothetical protein
MTGEPIQIFEIEVFVGSTDVAMQKPATQSSTLGKFAAFNAVDGVNTTFSHTNDKSPWLEVDWSVPMT